MFFFCSYFIGKQYTESTLCTTFLKLLLEQHGLHGLWCSFAIILKHPLCRHKCIQGMAAKCSHSIANALNRFTIKYHFPKMCSSAFGFHFSPSMQLTNGSVTAQFTRNGRSVVKKKKNQRLKIQHETYRQCLQWKLLISLQVLYV